MISEDRIKEIERHFLSLEILDGISAQYILEMLGERKQLVKIANFVDKEMIIMCDALNHRNGDFHTAGGCPVEERIEGYLKAWKDEG